MSPTHATIQDVARLAGVSTQTVSNVLNHPHRVRPATAERVTGAIEALGYRAHASARRLRTRRSDTVALRLDPMASGISGSILDVFLHEVTADAAALGIRVLLYTAASPAQEITTLANIVATDDVDGVILTGTGPADERPRWLAEHEVPFVTFGRPWTTGASTHSWVDVDGAAGTAAATHHLMAGGSRRVAYLGWPGATGQAAARRFGWFQAVASRGGAPEGSLAVEAEDRVAAGVAAAKALLAREPGIDGIVCASDSLALGALLAVGVDVPVIGFDNTAVARAVGLSSVDQRIDEVARLLLGLLVDEGRVVRREPTSRVVTPVLRARHAVIQDPGSPAE